MVSQMELKEKANNLFKLGDYSSALAVYNECLSISDVETDLCEVIHRNKAQCYLNLGDNEAAIVSATSALKICPGDTKALYRRCVALEKSGKLHEAIVDVKRLMQLDSKNKYVNELAFRLEKVVLKTKDEAYSLNGKINSMLSILNQKDASLDLLCQALKNLNSLVLEEKSTAVTRIWSHPSIDTVFKMCKHNSLEITRLTHQLLAVLIENNSEHGLQLLETLTPSYFIGKVFCTNKDVSLDMCHFLRRLLESLSQIKSYQKAKDLAVKNHEKAGSKPNTIFVKNSYPPYKIDSKLKKPIEEVLHHIIRATNSYRLQAESRDSLLELLTSIVPYQHGIDWSKQFVELEGSIERLLEIAAAASASFITRRPVARSNRAASPTAKDDEKLPELSRGGILKTTANTRLTVACLLARLYDDMVADKQRQYFSQQCADFVMDLLTDKFIESKVEAAAVIGTLFSGPFDVGCNVLAREGVLEGILLLTQAENIAYQTVALDAIILATNKKDKCLAIIDQAVPILRMLYKSGDDAIKVRALVGLCKLGALGGTDASMQSMAEGSTVVLTKACRRLLLPKQQSTTSDTSNSPAYPTNDDPAVDFARIGPLDEANSTRWAIDGLAFLSLNAEVKEAIVNDAELVARIFTVPQLGYLDAAFPLASLLANLTNSFEGHEITPEMIELAKYAKQHIPQQHELDAPKVVTQRRLLLIDTGLPGCLYNLTKLATGTVAAQPGIRELISRVYLSAADCVEKRGLLVSAGAGKALLNLALDQNSEAGSFVAAQALAKLTITSDPRITFAGQRSLEVIRPILQLLKIDCSALQNFEGLLAITNLASLDEAHRSRILSEKGLPAIDHYMFEDHPQLRRAATECFSNLAQHHATVVGCGGTLPLDEHASIGKNIVTATGSERVKLLMLFCLDTEDVFLVRAAAGALATMSYDPGVIKKMTEVSNWFEILQAIAAHPAPSIQHRGAHILRNMIVYGERSLAEHLAKSCMLEVLMALSQQPKINVNSLPPEAVVLCQGRPMDAVRREAQMDHERTIESALEALKKLAEFKFIQAVGGD